MLFHNLETIGIIKTPKELKLEEEYSDYKDLEKYNNMWILSIGWLYIKNFDYDNWYWEY